MESNVDKQATIKPLPVSDYELSPEAGSKDCQNRGRNKTTKRKD